jgi:hypothetical protein
VAKILDEQPDLQVIVVGDRDDAGIVGASGLAEDLEDHLDLRIRVALPRPPFKDLRDQVVAGKWDDGLEFQRRKKVTPTEAKAKKPGLIRRAFARAVKARVERRDSR